MRKIRNKLIAAMTVLMISGSAITAFAATNAIVTGTWYSAYEADLNGVSQVGTKYLSAPAVYCDLAVLASNGNTIGTKHVAVGQNQTVEHTCWGDPFLARRGRVIITGQHSPWFNA